MPNASSSSNERFILPFGFGVRFTRERGFSFTRPGSDGQTRTVPHRRYVKSPPAVAYHRNNSETSPPRNDSETPPCPKTDR